METSTTSKCKWQKPYKITLAIQLFADIAILVVVVWLAVYIKPFIQTLNVPWGHIKTEDLTFNFRHSVSCFNGTTSCVYFSGGYIAYGFTALIFFFGTAAGIYGTSVLLNSLLCGESENYAILWKQLKYWRRVNFASLTRDIIFTFISAFYNGIYLAAFLLMIVFRAVVLLIGYVYTISVKVQLELNMESEITD